MFKATPGIPICRAFVPAVPIWEESCAVALISEALGTIPVCRERIFKVVIFIPGAIKSSHFHVFAGLSGSRKSSIFATSALQHISSRVWFCISLGRQQNDNC